MLQPSDFEVIQAQASVFTPGLNLHTTRVLAELLAVYADTFNGDPVTIPGVEGFPLEAPRLMLQSRDGKQRLQAGPSRLDLFQASFDAQGILPLPQFLEWCLRLFDSYLAITQGRVGRTACVVTRRACADEPAREVATQFCKQALLDGPFVRPSDFEVHAGKQFDLADGIRVNGWFRCKSALLIGPQGQRQRAVTVEQDINTTVEEAESRDFGQDDRRQFFGLVPGAFSRDMESHFPQLR